MARKRKKEQKTESFPVEDWTGALKRLTGYVPFELNRRGNEVRDEQDGLTLVRKEDTLSFARSEVRLWKSDGETIRLASTVVREVRMFRIYVRQGDYHLWHTELSDYEGNRLPLAITRNAEKSWKFATTIARLLNVPFAHGKNFHRRIPQAELHKSVWDRADSAPLDNDPPRAPPGFEMKEHDGAIELLAKDERKHSPVLREWASFAFASSLLAAIITILVVASIYADMSLLSRVAPLAGVAFFLAVARELWRTRPRPRVVEAQIRVTTNGHIVWKEKAGGRSSHNTYDADQYLDVSIDPAYLVSIEGERHFTTQFDPHMMKPIGEWLERALIYCRALRTGRRRQALLNQDPVDPNVAATDVLKKDPVPVKVD